MDTRAPSQPVCSCHIPRVSNRICRVVNLHLLSGGTHLVTSTMNSQVCVCVCVCVCVRVCVHACVFVIHFHSQLQLWDIRMNRVIHSFAEHSNSHHYCCSLLDDRESFITAGETSVCTCAMSTVIVCVCVCVCVCSSC